MKSKTIKEIRELYNNNQLTEANIDELRIDERKGVQAVVSAYERQQKKHEQLINQFTEMTKYERHYRQLNKMYIAGVDEAGRGPLAGPVVVAAVILPKDFELLGLTDSKQLKEEKRNEFAQIIKREAISWHVSVIDHKLIDQINIFEATKKAMKEALIGLNPLPDQALIDAVNVTGLSFPSESIIKGDAQSISIAAASIIAKVTRDEIMREIDKEYPMYRFKSNMGYGTKEHLQMIEKYGISPYHRQSFGPVRRLISGGDT